MAVPLPPKGLFVILVSFRLICLALFNTGAEMLMNINRGISAIAGIVKNAMKFSAEEYRKGTNETEEKNDHELFCELFSKWKSMVEMEAELRSTAIKRSEGLLDKRIDGIMGANRRNYYGE